MIAQVAIALLALYLLVGEPLLGRVAYRRMLAALRGSVPAARTRFYRQWIAQGWLLLAVTLVITLGVAGWTPDALGLQWPHWPHPLPVGHGFGAGVIAGMVGAAIAGFVVAAAVTRQRKRRQAPPRPMIAGNRELLQMLPTNRRERVDFAALALTAGITEEVIWRGFGLTLLFALLPGLHPALQIALAALAFGWAHLYQGIVGVLATAVLGAALATLFWASGSLLWPIVAHVLIDLRALLTRHPESAIEGGTP